MSHQTSVSINLLGCLPWVLGFLILGALGFCGAECQSDIVGGIKTVREATR